MAQKILSWHHTGFLVHSRVRVKTKEEAEREGKYIIRPLLSLERLFFLDQVARRIFWSDASEYRVFPFLDIDHQPQISFLCGG